MWLHESSYMDDNVEVGEHTKIWHFSHIQAGAKIGKHCILGQNVNIGPGVIIGDGVKIQNNVSVFSGVVIEDNVFIGPSVVFTNAFNPRSWIDNKKDCKPTIVKHGASIGANATVVCGNTIGEYAFVGSGAVVTKAVPCYGLCYGVPAILKGWVCECGVKLNPQGAFNYECAECNKSYMSKGILCGLQPL